MAIELPTGWSNFVVSCNPPPICTDVTARGQQVIEFVEAFDLSPASDRASWGHINNGELWALGGNSFCSGGNMGYVSGDPALPLDCGANRSVAMFHFVNDIVTPLEVLPVPSPPGDGNSFINVLIGVSDRPVWAAASNVYHANGGIRAYYDIGTVAATYGLMAGGGASVGFCVRGDEFWLFARSSIQPPVAHFLRYDRVAGGLAINDYTPFGNDDVSISNFHLTDDFIYAVGNLAGVNLLYKISRATGTITSSLVVTALNVNFLAVANDNLLYLICSGTPAKVYYVENFTTPIYVGRTPGSFTPFGGGTAIWNNGTLYFGSTGFAGFSDDIQKIAIACPPDGGDPIIASVTTDASVVAGAAINVTWADVLVPASTDQIQIKPEPAAGTFGLVGTTIATGTNPGALSDGSVSITIPGGTTPGNYVAMYCALAGSGNVWVATSAAFTVT